MSVSSLENGFPTTVVILSHLISINFSSILSGCSVKFHCLWHNIGLDGLVKVLSDAKTE